MLNQGDILFFNRRLIHQGGANKSSERRNALILQYVCLWGVGQEILNMEKIVNVVKDIREENMKNGETEADNLENEKEAFNDFITRIQPPYPKDTRLGT